MIFQIPDDGVDSARRFHPCRIKFYVATLMQEKTLAVIFRENIAGVDPAITVQQPQSGLFQFVLFQKGQALRSKLHGTDLSVIWRSFVMVINI